MNALFEQYLKEAQSKGSLNYAKDRPLSAVSTFGIGGNAAFFVVPRDITSAIELIRELYRFGERYILIGGASDLLFDDEGFDGVVVSVKKLSDIRIENGHIYAECGVTLPRLCRSAAENALTGFEGLCSIPATVGGALKMNAGAYGYEISDLLERVSVYLPSTDEVTVKNRRDCSFTYRSSRVANAGEMILSAVFAPQKGDVSEILKRSERYRQKRTDSQPIGAKSAGSYFKKPNAEGTIFAGKSAGELIELCGLKGRSVGGAYVSEKHGNFIINKDGSAGSSDVLALAEIVKSTVFKETGVILEEEVIYVRPSL